MNKGERVNEVRKSLKMTLESFGEKLGVGKTAISKIEKGERGLTDQMATAICRTYNVNYDWLMEEEGEMFSDLPDTILDELCKQYGLDDFDKSLVEMYIQFPQPLRDYLKKNLLEVLKKNCGDVPEEK